MDHSGAEPINQFREQKFPFQEGVTLLVNLAGQRTEKFVLHAGKDFGGLSTVSGQMRIGPLPLTKLLLPLTLGRTDLTDQLF